MKKIIQIHSADNVAIALSALQAGTDVSQGVVLKNDVPAGHKIAMSLIAAGKPVIKYGFTIGHATRDIAAGEHVHTHNVASDLHADLAAASYVHKVHEPAKAIEKTFLGYRRQNGKVAVRNDVWIIPTVGCVNQASEKIARAAHAKYAGKGVDGVYAFVHPLGCSQLGDDLENTQNILAGLIRHPNAGAVLLLGLGCENNQMKLMLEKAGCQDDLASGRVKFFNAQDVPDEIESGLLAVTELVAYAQQFKREPIPARELILGMKCGGSDGFSGVTANPLVGRIADRLTAQGGTTLLTEVPEMFGAEQVLLDRADDVVTFNSIIGLVNNFRAYFRSYSQPIDENPSPGNKAGGLTTNADKSLGCVQKAGNAPIRGVLAYGQPAISQKAGVMLINAPGNDGVSATAMTAAGAHMILFTTGRGNPMGFPVPTIKISSNSDLFKRKPSWIDFNAGQIVDSDKYPDALADELFELVLAIASGKKLARNEINDNREIAIWKNGVTL